MAISMIGKPFLKTVSQVCTLAIVHMTTYSCAACKGTGYICDRHKQAWRTSPNKALRVLIAWSDHDVVTLFSLVPAACLQLSMHDNSIAFHNLC